MAAKMPLDINSREEESDYTLNPFTAEGRNQIGASSLTLCITEYYIEFPFQN
jgi:hypothetical protein